MGYFSNGTEGMSYQEQFCDRCLHDNADKGIYCPVWNLHLRDNYKECNNEGAAIHQLIPRSKTDLGNDRCKMFVDRGMLSNLQIEKYESDALRGG